MLWLGFALGSAFFAGITAVLAKVGMKNVNFAMRRKKDGFFRNLPEKALHFDPDSPGKTAPKTSVFPPKRGAHSAPM